MKAIDNFRVVFLGGGGGGHIYPLVAVTHALRDFLQKRGVVLSARYFGSPGNMGFYLEREGIKVSKIASSKFRRYFSILNFFDIFKFFFGMFQAFVKLFFFMSDVVFSKGGPGAFGVILVARWYRIPIVIHESDAVPGLTNRKSAKYAKIIELSFEQAKPFFGGYENVNFVGTPVRKHLSIDESPKTSRLSFGLPDKLPTLLIIGGSQGAQPLNNFFLENSELILSSFEIIHQVGPNNFKPFMQEYEFMSKNYKPEIKKNYHAMAYLNDREMAAALNACDIVVSRAGSSIFELAYVGKPAVLVPLPNSANDHQRANAYAYAKHGAGIVIEEENLKGHLFVQQIKRMLDDTAALERMRMSARTFYKPDAADTIASDLLNASDISKFLVQRPAVSS